MQGFINFARSEMAHTSNTWAQDEESGEIGSLPVFFCSFTCRHAAAFNTEHLPLPQFPHPSSAGLQIKAAACIL